MLNCIGILLVSFVQLLTLNNEIELVFAGDAMQHKPQATNAQRPDGTFDYSNCFSLIKEDVLKADFAALNLECPLGGKPYTGYPCFSAPDEYALALKNVGFDLFLTANNHSLDRRDKGGHRTIEILDSLKIPHIGTYSNIAARDTLMPFVMDIKGVKFAFMGYTYGTNGIPVQKDFVVDYIDRKKILSDIANAKAAGAQMLCVMLHWGIEYQLLPNKEQKDLAQFLMDNGVDMIIGGHPHVIQPYELKVNPKTGKNCLLVYSLGNFISNQNSTDSRGGAMVTVRVVANGSKSEIKSADYSLFFVQKPSYQANYYQLIPADKPELILPHSKAQFNQFVKNARRIFDKHNINVPEK